MAPTTAQRMLVLAAVGAAMVLGTAGACGPTGGGAPAVTAPAPTQPADGDADDSEDANPDDAGQDDGGPDDSG